MAEACHLVFEFSVKGAGFRSRMQWSIKDNIVRDCAVTIVWLQAVVPADRLLTRRQS